MVEMLLGSGLRISELLSLDRGQIDPAAREAKIVGKGGKERTAFFTDRAVSWLGKYLELRDDDCKALFVDLFGRRMRKRSDATWWASAGVSRREVGVSS